MDVDKDGSLEIKEIRKFLNNMCLEMGMEEVPDEQTLSEIFEELDEDGSMDIDLDEMKAFLRKIFIMQRDDIARILETEKQ